MGARPPARVSRGAECAALPRCSRKIGFGFGFDSAAARECSACAAAAAVPPAAWMGATSRARRRGPQCGAGVDGLRIVGGPPVDPGNINATQRAAMQSGVQHDTWRLRATCTCYAACNTPDSLVLFRTLRPYSTLCPRCSSLLLRCAIFVAAGWRRRACPKRRRRAGPPAPCWSAARPRQTNRRARDAAAPSRPNRNRNRCAHAGSCGPTPLPFA